MTDALPIAGWYPDPDAPGGDRWWNGTAWSEQRRGHASDSPTTQAMDSATATPSNVPALLGFILALMGVALPVGVFALTGGIISIVGLQRSKQLAAHGPDNTGRRFAIAGIIIGFAFTVIAILQTIALISVLVWGAAYFQAVWLDLGAYSSR